MSKDKLDHVSWHTKIVLYCTVSPIVVVALATTYSALSLTCNRVVRQSGLYGGQQLCTYSALSLTSCQANQVCTEVNSSGACFPLL